MLEKDAATMGGQRIRGVVPRGPSCQLLSRQSHMKLDQVAPRLARVRGNARSRAVAPELQRQLDFREERRRLVNVGGSGEVTGWWWA